MPMPDDTDLSGELNVSESRHFLEACLFYNVNAFSRQLLKMAEVEFASLKLSPAHASLMLILYENPGIHPKKLGNLLQLTPSTITRFIDALARKNLVKRKNCGKHIEIFPTPKGLKAKPAVAEAYKSFYQAYTRMLGSADAHRLALQIHHASQRLAGVSEKDSHGPDL